MLTAVHNFIPVLTSEAGLCLTKENWQEAKVTATSYSMEQLLYKPGCEVLENIVALTEYLACPGELIINAMSLVSNKEKRYVLKSPFDGSKSTFTVEELVHLIHHLNPKAVLLPPNITRDFPQIWENWNENIEPFIHVADVEKSGIPKHYGVYFNILKEVDWEQLDRWSHLNRYVVGNFDPQQILDFQNNGISLIETDAPSQEAMLGRVYSREGTLDLTEPKTEMQFATIDAECVCPTCSQQLTRAYLHHLFAHTPLLCQRFLIQHNVFYTQSFMTLGEIKEIRTLKSI